MPVRPPRRTRSRSAPGGLRTAGVLGGLLAVALAGGGLGAPLAGQESGAVPPVPVEAFRLANGLRVVVSEDHASAVAAVSVWYHVGRAHEGDGRRGFAALVQRVVGRDAQGPGAGSPDSPVARAGGYSDAAVGPDHTAFTEVLPAGRLEAALRIQAGRMAPPRVTEGMLESWRWALEEERRPGLGARPYASALLALDTLSRDYGPYRSAGAQPGGGGDRTGPGDVEAFHGTFYVPSNAVLVVVGDVDAGDVRRLTERHFGGLPAGGPVPELPPPGPSPRTDGGRRLAVREPGASRAAVWVSHPVPPADHPDRHALELLRIVLGPGAGSRLGRRLGGPDGPAAGLDVVLEGRVGPGTLRIGAVAAEDRDAGLVEGLVLEEVERLRREEVGAMEVARALERRRAEQVGRLLTLRGRASALQWHVLHEGSADAVNREMARFEAVSAGDVRRVARTYLAPGGRTVVVARPATGSGE